MVKSSRDPDSVKKKKSVAKSKEHKEMHTEMHGGSSGPGAGAMAVDPHVQNEIGRHLRAIYDDVIKEPVPLKFLELLEKLERSTKRKG